MTITKKIKYWYWALPAMVGVGIPLNNAFAQNPVPCPDGWQRVQGVCVPGQQTGGGLFSNVHTVTDLIFLIINILLWAAAFVAIIFIIVGGFVYMTAGGDSEKSTNGRKWVVNALVGLVIVILALFLVRFVSNIVGTGVGQN